MGSWRRGSVAGVLALVAAGCGTTVPHAGQVASGTATSAGSASAPGSTPWSGTAAPASSGTQLQGSPPAASGAGPAGPSAASPAGGGAVTAPGGPPEARSPGVTAATVAVGVLYPTNTGAEAAALGIAGLSTGDERAQAAAIIADANAHGGLAGRRIAPVYEPLDATKNTNNPDLNFQAACADLTQDHKVFAVVTVLNLPDDFLVCLHQHGVTAIDDAAEADAYLANQIRGLFYAPGDFVIDRAYRDEVDALVSSGWLAPASKIGIYSYSSVVAQRVVSGTVEPELARHGLHAVAAEAVDNTEAGISADASVSLKFHSLGVDRVISVTASPLFLMESAQSQGYHPRYALNSAFGPGALLETAAPAGQLQGAAGIGWQPLSDVDRGHQPPPVSPNQTRCTQLMTQAGQGSTSSTTQLFEAQLCDTFFFLAAALRSEPTVSPAAIAAGAAALGNAFPSPVTFRAAFPNGRPDGADAYRDIGFQSSCSCFVYTSPEQPA